MQDTRNGITAVASAVGRVPSSVRQWERQGRLPEHLLPHRDERGHRFWTDEQVEQLKRWVEEQDLRPGKGLEQYWRDYREGKVTR